MKVLIVEDELPVARQIAAALTEDGHDPKAVHSGEAALEELGKRPFDLIVLDVRLPGIDGFELLRRMREQHLASRVLLLTGRSAIDDRVTGLQLGADDYLPKPFAMRELVARVRALGRRYPEEPVICLRVGDITLDPRDLGRFKSPSLRNVERTAPYMHDGRFDTLEKVIDHYSKGIQSHPNLDPRMRRLNFTDSEKAALIAFLRTLTDHAFLADPKFSDPWR